MASPQIEDGYLKLANELSEALAKVNLSPYESRVIQCIFRKTYGYGKKFDRISFSQFSEITKLHNQHIARTLKMLLARNIIFRNGKGYKISYGIQKDYDKWKGVPPVEKTSPKVEKQLEKKEKTKETSKKKALAVSKEDIDSIFKYWNEMKVIVHDKMTDSMETAIKNTVTDFGKAKVMQAITNYGQLLNGDYDWTYRWTLQDFLSRGKGNNIERFKDMGVLKQNYGRKNGINRGYTEESAERKYTEPPPFRE